MRTQLRIVAGSLKGRKLSFTINPALRPTPQMVREALFSILGDAVPGRPFFDVFAGTGVIGLEALSRGAASVLFVERDFRLSAELERNIAAFGVRAIRAHRPLRRLPLDRTLAAAGRTRRRLSQSPFRGLRATPRRSAEPGRPVAR